MRSFFVVRGLSNCGAWAQKFRPAGLCCREACGILVPRPGIKPVSPVLQGRFLSTGPPGGVLCMLWFLLWLCSLTTFCWIFVGEMTVALMNSFSLLFSITLIWRSLCECPDFVSPANDDSGDDLCEACTMSLSSGLDPKGGWKEGAQTSGFPGVMSLEFRLVLFRS